MEAAKVKAEEFEYANEILITKSELEEKNRLVFNLQQQVDETRTESEYQLRLKDNKFAEEFKMNKKQSEAEIGELTQQISRMQTDMRNTMRGHETELGNAQEENEKAMVEMAEQYKSKLIVEYQKFDNLEEKYNNIEYKNRRFLWEEVYLCRMPDDLAMRKINWNSHFDSFLASKSTQW